ncbi:hypothetical protein DAEQUDRAFT_815695 [Daedalea quercina L-15889]|uniref:Uncharacterized protein n=1 Tax=Daedalea quercina L-15889 TaxID=1314783 RepID=A0A165KNK6_9APHY|nr:hypothetical protein DAEQUDRAFT_815695 [Daedalea quercina L-15889]
MYASEQEYTSEVTQTDSFAGGDEVFQDTRETEVTNDYEVEPDGQVFDTQTVQQVDSVDEEVF